MRRRRASTKHDHTIFAHNHFLILATILYVFFMIHETLLLCVFWFVCMMASLRYVQSGFTAHRYPVKMGLARVDCGIKIFFVISRVHLRTIPFDC